MTPKISTHKCESTRSETLCYNYHLFGFECDSEGNFFGWYQRFVCYPYCKGQFMIFSGDYILPGFLTELPNIEIQNSPTVKIHIIRNVIFRPCIAAFSP